MRRIDSVVVTGPSGGGKTTAVNALREPQFEHTFVIPMRYSTRPDRPGDDPRESQHLSREEFEERVAKGTIRPAWRRALDIGRIELYGFEIVPPEDTRFRVYSANNAILRDDNESVRELLATAQVAILTATRSVRQERLQSYAGSISPRERSYRLDLEEELLTVDGSEIIISTTEGGVIRGQQTFLDHMIRILNERDALS